jgi:hypothetical protein
MTVDRCDFQVPPAVPGWYGILSETESKAAFWNGTDWADLLRLLRVKRRLLSLHALNQMVDPIKGWLICDPGRQHTVMLDFGV